VYLYLRRPLLLVQAITDNHRIWIFYVFAHLFTGSIIVCLTVFLFLFLPQIWMIQKQYLMIKQQI
jgi:hypothetical protein